MSRRAKRICGSIVLVLLVFLLWPYRISLLDRPHSIVVESDDGELLSAQIADDGQWRFPMISKEPERFAQAITLYEDRRFWYHPGVDPISLGRAIVQNIKNGKVISGASTLTMQCVRLSYPGSRRSFGQKLKEMLLAVKLDAKWSKKEILRLYATHAPFGGNVVGLEAAAWRYFQRSAEELSWAETATLAVLPNAPSLVTIEKNRDRLIEKRNTLLTKLYDNGFMSRSDLELARSEPLVPGLYALPREAPHYLEWLRSQGRTGRTNSTIDSELQERVAAILNGTYDRYAAMGIHNAAVLVLNNRTQEIRSYVANIPITTEERDVDMIQARRSSGSILKPILYAAMLSEGQITPSQLIADKPVSIDGFSPANYHRSYEGAVPVSTALSRSLNIPFVLLLQKYGVDKFVKVLRALQLTTIDRSSNDYGLSLILGGAEVTLYEMTELYSRLSRRLLGEESITSLSRSAVHHTYEAMRQLNRPNDHGGWQQYTSSKPIAWKTGTSYGHRDAWAIGTTPGHTIGVWVGNADGEGRDQLTGVSTAGQILFEVLDALPSDEHWFPVPYEEMEYVAVCRHSGMLPVAACPLRDTVLLSRVMERTAPCPYHVSVLVDQTGSHRLARDCDEEGSQIRSQFVLPPTMAYYYKQHHSDYRGMPPWSEHCTNNTDEQQMEIVYPHRGEVVFLPRDFDGELQELVIRLSYAGQSDQIYWYLDDVYLGVTEDFHSMTVRPSAGEHDLMCLAQSGERITSTFTVVSQ